MWKVLFGALLLVCVANAASIEDLKIVDKATIEDTVVEVTTETTPEENKVSESTTEVRNICFFSTLVPSKREKNV